MSREAKMGSVRRVRGIRDLSYFSLTSRGRGGIIKVRGEGVPAE